MNREPGRKSRNLVHVFSCISVEVSASWSDVASLQEQTFVGRS